MGVLGRTGFGENRSVARTGFAGQRAVGKCGFETETAWTPAPLSKEGWWDSSDLNSIISSGGDVSQWNDLSGNGNHLVQATGANQPKTGTRTLGGLNAIDFDGVDHFMDVTYGATITQPNTIFAVAQSDVATGQQYIMGGVDATDRNILIMNATPVWDLYAGTDLPGGSADTSPHAFGGVFDGVSSELFVDGLSQATGDVGAGDSAGLTVGRRYATPFRYWNGIICELIVIDGTLSTADRQNVEGYLAWKWGFEINLPSEHPYRFDGSKFGHETLWTPSEMTSEAWFDLDDGDTVTLGTGIEIEFLGDKSGNSNTLTNAASARPDWEIKGWDAVRRAMFFDGDDGLAIATMLGTSGSSWVCFAVIDQDSTAKTRQTIINSADAPMRTFSKTSGTYPGIGFDDDTISFIGETGPFTTGKQIITWVLETNGEFYRNGNALGVGSWTFSGYDFVGGELGLAIPTVEQFGGHMGEILIARRSICTEPLRKKIEGYLAWKWSLVSLLPTAHLYKNEPPTL